MRSECLLTFSIVGGWALRVPYLDTTNFDKSLHGLESCIRDLMLRDRKGIRIYEVNCSLDESMSCLRVVTSVSN